MEVPKPAQTAYQNLPPNPYPPPSCPPQSKKRTHDDTSNLQNSHYYKMRAVLKDLRPHFIQVLQVPNFKGCSAANEIHDKMKHLMDLYKELTAETSYLEKHKTEPQVQPSTNDVPNSKLPELHQEVNMVDQPSSYPDYKPPPSMSTYEKQQSEDGQKKGTYIIGGSAFGWNFITYGGGKAVYYGRTKESFQSANPGPQEGP